MRAAVVRRYGGPEVVAVEERAVPVPRAGEALVRVVATAVTSGDAKIRAAAFADWAVPARLVLGIRAPRRSVLGIVFSGEVAAIGPNGADHRLAGDDGQSSVIAVGDRVCGMSGMRMGAHAEQIAVPLDRLTRVPDTVSHDDAAGVLFGGTTALYFLRDKAALAAGEHVLIIGASGAVGSNAVQLAKHFGAHVTATTSARNATLVAELGADRVIDYHSTRIEDLDTRFDVIFDTVGVLSPATGRPLLADGGRLLLAVATMAQTISARGQVMVGTAPERAEDFATLLRLVAEKRLRVVIDQTLPLQRIAEAHARVDSRRQGG